MGTNYYLEEKAPCQSCGREFDRKHIGKSSAGWVFMLHVYPEDNINDLPDWIDLWEKSGARIFDEYGKQITPTEILVTIMARTGRAKMAEKNDSHWYAQNQAIPGPWGLARYRVDGARCIGHGAGTYDLHIGDFS